jgi:hypothetical protein
LAKELAILIAYVGDKLSKDGLINQVATRLGIGAEEMRGSVVEAEKLRARGKVFEQRQASKDSNAVATRLGIGAEEMRGSVVEAEKLRARGKFFEQRQASKDSNADTAMTPKAQATPMNGSIAYLCHLALMKPLLNL